MLDSKAIVDEFLKNWLAEVQSDEPNVKVMGGGLCGNLSRLLRTKHNDHVVDAIMSNLYKRFEDSGLDVCYPFGKDAYFACLKNATFNQDENRVQWVIDQVSKMEG